MKIVENSFQSQWEQLLRQLKAIIGDDHRATDDPEDDQPGMQVTIGYTPESEDENACWHYQTGDNSYTGGAYNHPHWAVIYLYRDSDPAELAADAVSQIHELMDY